MEQLIQDLRYGFRTFVRQPAVASTAVLALALGIGVNTAVFSVVYAALLRVIGRMKPGVTLQQASDDLRAVTASFNTANKLQRDVKVYSLHDYLSARNRQILLVMQEPSRSCC